MIYAKVQPKPDILGYCAAQVKVLAVAVAAAGAIPIRALHAAAGPVQALPAPANRHLLRLHRRPRLHHHLHLHHPRPNHRALAPLLRFALARRQHRHHPRRRLRHHHRLRRLPAVVTVISADQRVQSAVKVSADRTADHEPTAHGGKGFRADGTRGARRLPELTLTSLLSSLAFNS
ncbi:hypothetical protein TSMEX_004846 [Taenia solium]